MGDSPASADHSGLAGGPAGSTPAELGPAPSSNPKHLTRLVTYRRADGMLVTAMRPVPNPESLSPADRREIYGGRYAPRAFIASSHRRRHVEVAVQPASQITARPAPALTPTKAAAPKAAPTKPLTIAKLAPPPQAATPPAKAVEPARPAPPTVAEAAAPPASSPAVSSPPGLKAPADPKLAALQGAIGAEVANGSKLTVPDNLPVGQAGQVSLSLPQTLLASLQREAGKLGLGKAAKAADVTATLSGQGYEITPNGPQTAQLKAGEAPSFSWQVKPGAGEKGALRADVDASLKGLRLPMSFSLAGLEQSVKAAMPLPAPAARGPWMDVLSIPGLKDVEVPGLGRVPSRSIVGGLLVLLALLILISMARNAGERAEREERRRKFRTMTDYGSKPLAPAFEEEPLVTAPLIPAPLIAAPAVEAHPAPTVTEAAADPLPIASEAAAAPVETPPVEGHADPARGVEPAAHPVSGGAASEDDYGLSQVVREGRAGADAHREVEPT